jgi:hypothetical protein
MYLKIMTLFLVLITQMGWASPNNTYQSPKYQISICAIFKNEANYLKEWIEYHRLIGVDHFYLYNNNSSDRPLYMLLPYIKMGFVTLISWPDALKEWEQPSMWSLSTQIPAYENAIKTRAKNETEWLILMDVDEFLVPTTSSSLKEILKRHDRHPGLVLKQDCFDASETSIAQDQLLIEAHQLIGSETLACTSIEKMIFKPRLCEYFSCFPYKYCFKNDQNAAQLEKREIRINKYLHRFKNHLFFGKSKPQLCIDSRLLADQDLQGLLESGYTIHDQENVITPYIPQMKKIMGLTQ